MESAFHEGDILVINPDLKQKQNDYWVVCNKAWKATFKQLKKYRKTQVVSTLSIRNTKTLSLTTAANTG